jgi:small subunit ribosomal protein S6
MVILPADADEATVTTAVERIRRTVEPDGGSIGAVDRWGRRRFAYPIAHQHEGTYVVVRFTASPASQAELERVLNLADEVVRHKIVVLPPGAGPTAGGDGRSRGGETSGGVEGPSSDDAVRSADRTPEDASTSSAASPTPA